MTFCFCNRFIEISSDTKELDQCEQTTYNETLQKFSMDDLQTCVMRKEEYRYVLNGACASWAPPLPPFSPPLPGSDGVLSSVTFSGKTLSPLFIASHSHTRLL